MKKRWRLDESRLTVGIVGRLVDEYLDTDSAWFADGVRRTIAKLNRRPESSCVISVYSVLIDGLPAEVVVVLVNADTPVCFIGYTPDVLICENLSAQVRQEVRQMVDEYRAKH